MLNAPQYRPWGSMESRGPLYAVNSVRDMEVVYPFFATTPPSGARHHRGHESGHVHACSDLGIKQEPPTAEENLTLYPPAGFSDRRLAASPTPRAPLFAFPQLSLGAHGAPEMPPAQRSPEGGAEEERRSSRRSHKAPLILSRARREFVPEEKKDDMYWAKRLKNNASARRSRIKRKALEMESARRLLELERINLSLRHELAALRRRFGLASADCVGLHTPPPMPGDADDDVTIGDDYDENDDDDKGDDEEMDNFHDNDNEADEAGGEEGGKACAPDTPPSSLPPLSPKSPSSGASNRSWSPASQSSQSPRADAMLPLKCRLKGGLHSAFHAASQNEGGKHLAQAH